MFRSLLTLAITLSLIGRSNRRPRVVDRPTAAHPVHIARSGIWIPGLGVFVGLLGVIASLYTSAVSVERANDSLEYSTTFIPRYQAYVSFMDSIYETLSQLPDPESVCHQDITMSRAYLRVRPFVEDDSAQIIADHIRYLSEEVKRTCWSIQDHYRQFKDPKRFGFDDSTPPSARETHYHTMRSSALSVLRRTTERSVRSVDRLVYEELIGGLSN